MPTEWSILFLQVRDALGLTQKELGELLGMDRRTIQRWEERGGIGMSRKQGEILEAALRPAHAELADTVVEAVRLEQVRDGQLVRAAATAAAGTHPSAVVAAMVGTMVGSTGEGM